jgi:hypothetical protein
MRTALQGLSVALTGCGRGDLADQALRAAGSPDEQLIAYVTSNDIWGGSGSIADHVGLEDGKRTDKTRALEAALIRLGTAQIEAGVVNPRTASWVGTFQQWAKSGI